MNIDAMEAGPEMDDAVAERVFGYVIDRFVFEYDGFFKECRVWVDKDGKKHNPKPYSTDIDAAWEVVEKMRELGHFDCGSPYRCGQRVIGAWWARFGSNLADPCTAYTAPLAICRAALKAVRA